MCAVQLEETTVEDIRQFTAKLTSGRNARSKCRNFLMMAGIIDNRGELTLPYSCQQEIKGGTINYQT